MPSNNLFIKLGVRSDKRAFNRMRELFSKLESRTKRLNRELQAMGSKLIGVGKRMTAALTLPIGLAGAAMVKVAGDFESALNILEAKTGASKDELDALKETAKELGKTTQFTASQVAEGMIELAKAGLKPRQILDSIGASLDFAVASGLSLAEVSAAMADTFGQFTLKSTRARDVADLFTKASDSATTNVLELVEAMGKAGASANVVGNSMEDTFAVLTALANVGQKASLAGTALANGFVFLGQRGKKAVDTLARLGINIDDLVDKTGRLKVPFSEVIIRLGKANASLVDLIDIFDARAGKVLAGAVKNFAYVERAIGDLGGAAGNAEKQAKTVMKGFNGAIKELISALEGLALAIADTGLLKFVTDMVKGLTKFIRRISELHPAILSIGALLLGFVAVIGPLTLGIGLLIKALAALALVSGVTWLAMLGPLTIVLGTILAIAAAAWLLWDDFKGFQEGKRSVFGFATKYGSMIGTKIGEYIKAKGGDIKQAILDAIIAPFKFGFDFLKIYVNNIFDDIEMRITQLGNMITNAFSGLLNFGMSFGRNYLGGIISDLGFDPVPLLGNAAAAGTSKIASGTSNNQTSNQSIQMSPTINVTVTGDGTAAGAYSVGSTIGKAIKDYLGDIFSDANQQLKPTTEQ